MTQQTFEFTYSVEEILNTTHTIELNKVIPNTNVINVPTNIIYVWDKTTQQYYERKSIPYPMPIKMNKIQWRNVTGCFDWNQAIKENKLPPEKSLLQKAYCFIFSCIYTD